jgi:hypothetical protein
MTDSDRESLIDAALEQLIDAKTEAAKRAHWADLVYHVKLRSPEQIFKMEAERRLASRMAPLFTYECIPANEARGSAGSHGAFEKSVGPVSGTLYMGLGGPCK